MASLQEGQYPTDEDAMNKAERAIPIPEHAATELTTNASVAVADLWGLLHEIMKAAG